MALALGTIVYDTFTRNALRDALDTAINSGAAPVLRLLTSGAVLLAEVPFDTTDAFTNSSPGLLTLNTAPRTVNAVASGVPTNYEIRIDPGGAAQLIATGTVTGTDTINSGQPVNLTAMTITINA
jgi:hypothetical protein